MSAALFSPLRQRGLTLPNRIVVSPMSQYSAIDGAANDWHLVTYGKLAQGGAGAVLVETAAVASQGRGTYGDLGIWHDDHVASLRRLADGIAAMGAVPGLQLGHAGRKACVQRPWEGYGALTAAEHAKGEIPWPIVAPSALPVSQDAAVPTALDGQGLELLLQAWESAARRAARAGFRILEIHCAHGYLLHQFLSPLSNLRTDAYGGSPERRRAFPLEVVRRVRAAWPADYPLWVRVSAVDGADGGLTLDDTVEFARELKPLGVDLVDCSSGGIAGPSTAGSRIPRGLGFQVPYAQAVRRDGGIATMAVGLILYAAQAELIIAQGQADLVALGRELLRTPNWPLHARRELLGQGYEAWPSQYGWWLEKRAAILQAIGVDEAMPTVSGEQA